ncbi:MAG: glycosyltransferase family 39 protein [Devosia sp.]
MADTALSPGSAAKAVTAVTEVKHLRLLQAIALVFILIKLVYTFRAGPIFDEAYYWMWGGHFELSYFDHPPFHAWLLGLSHLLFGRSLLALRWMTLATLAVTFYIYHLWAKRYAGANWQSYFWPGVIIYLASPTFGIFGSIAQHDYMLVFLALLSGHFFVSYFVDYTQHGRGRLFDLYLGALFLGLTGLTKYSGVLLGIGVFLYILSNRSLRPLFRSPHLYIAALLAFVLQLPYIIWNAQNGFASFRFHLEDRHPANWLDSVKLNTLVEFIAVSIVLVGPFLVPVFVRFFRAQPETPFERTAQGLSKWVFGVSTLCFLAISLFDEVWWWWNLLAYVLVLPFAAKYMGQRILFYGHVIWGLAAQLYILFAFAFLPPVVFWNGTDPIRFGLFGWDQLQAPIEALEKQYHPDFIASPNPEIASVVGFALDNPDVTALSGENELRYLFDPSKHLGQTALIVVRDNYGMQFVKGDFDTVTPLAEIPVNRFGYSIGGFQIYLAKGFHPAPGY